MLEPFVGLDRAACPDVFILVSAVPEEVYVNEQQDIAHKCSCGEKSTIKEEMEGYHVHIDREHEEGGKCRTLHEEEYEAQCVYQCVEIRNICCGRECEDELVCFTSVIQLRCRLSEYSGHAEDRHEDDEAKDHLEDRVEHFHMNDHVNAHVCGERVLSLSRSHDEILRSDMMYI